MLGTLGSRRLPADRRTGKQRLLRALAYIGFFFNLFNLLPVVPLDGGRAMAAMAPWMWFLGFGALVALDFLVPNPILLIITCSPACEIYRRWEQRSRLPRAGRLLPRAPRQRLLVGAVYIGLIVVLAVGMNATHILTRAATASATSRCGGPPGGSAPDSRTSAFHVPLGLALADRLTLVIEVLAPGQGDLDLGVGPGEVNPGRHQRQAPLVDPARKTLDLAPVGQQLAAALGIVVFARGRTVGRDVDGVQPKLAGLRWPRSRPSAEHRRSAAP